MQYLVTTGVLLQAMGNETNTVGLDGLSERCAKYYKQGTSCQLGLMLPLHALESKAPAWSVREVCQVLQARVLPPPRTHAPTACTGN